MGQDDLFLVPEGHVVEVDVCNSRDGRRGCLTVGDGQQAADLLADAGHTPHLRQLVGDAVGGDDEHFG